MVLDPDQLEAGFVGDLCHLQALLHRIRPRRRENAEAQGVVVVHDRGYPLVEYATTP
jgi:hypothetical protein